MNIIKNGVQYIRRENGMLYTGPLDQSNKVGGTGEAVRNAVHNPTRLQRVLEMNPNPKVLDYGCGSGMLIDYFRDNGVWIDGYDKFSRAYNSPIPENSYDIITAIEIFEHLSEPYAEIDEMYKSLKEGGAIMVETSFSDWMTDDDPYINPSIGHSTIFSHAGLDELMVQKGFRPGNHINRNVRIYLKPKSKQQKEGLTLLTMGQGNPAALKRTLDSFKGICNEVIFGDLLIFESDRQIIRGYQEEYNMPIVEFEFNHIFKHGFANTLNTLAYYATNDFVLYMNIGEVMDGEFDVLGKLNNDFNTYYLTHAIEKHHWFRLYNRKELQWNGLIHEEVYGKRISNPTPVFQFADTEKDLTTDFYVKVMNDVKELCYFYQYLKLVDNPELIGATNLGWVDYAKDGYDNLKERLLKKGKRYQAFQEGNLSKFLEDIFTNPEFENERHESSELINYQGNRKLL